MSQLGLMVYLKIALNQIQIDIAYKVNYIFSILVLFIPISMSKFLWTNIYNNSTQTLPYSMNNMIIYSIIGICLYEIFEYGIEIYFFDAIRTGNIIIEILRPKNFRFRLFSREVGRAFSSIVMKFMPVFIICTIIFNIRLNEIKLVNVVTMLTMFILAFIIMFLINFICGLFSFWLTNIYGMAFAKKAIIFTLSGAFIPLWVFPEKWRVILLSTPFPYIYYAPLKSLVENLNLYEIGLTLINQIIWIVLLLIVSTLLWQVGSRKIFIQGG